MARSSLAVPLKKGTVPVGSVELQQEDHPWERDRPLFQQAARHSRTAFAVPRCWQMSKNRLLRLPDGSHSSSPLKKGMVPVGSIDLLRKNHSPERDSPLFQQAARAQTVQLVWRRSGSDPFNQLQGSTQSAPHRAVECDIVDAKSTLRLCQVQ